MKTGEKIKEIRLKKGITQKELADKIEISEKTIQQIEHGEHDVREYLLNSIADALGVNNSQLIEIVTVNNGSHSDNDRNWLALLHFSGILPLFFPTILIYNRKKAEINGMTEHYYAIIASQSIIFLIWILGLWGHKMTYNSTFSYGILVVGAIFSIINTLRVLNNQSIRYLFHLRYKNNNTPSIPYTK